MGIRLNSKNEVLEVRYGKTRWVLLEKLRKKTLRLMEALESRNILSNAYGSIARGDVTKDSDIDVFIITPSSSMEVELALDKNNFKPLRRILIQATPYYAPKGYFEIEKNVSVSLSMVKLRRNEMEFYKFAGRITANDIRMDNRVPGVDKRLMLIEPRKDGHLETSMIDRETYVSKLLGIDVKSAFERVHVLFKRDRSGRTGCFMELELSDDENFELVLNKLADRNPILRKRLNLTYNK